MKRLLAALTASAILFAGCTADAKEEVSSALGENQMELYGKVTSAEGNEIVLSVGTPETVAARQEEDSGRQGGGGMPGEIPDGGEFPGRDSPTAAGAQPGRAGRQQVILNETGEEQTLMIPVGTPVYLQSGNSSITVNFLQIMVDDIIKVVTRKDNGSILSVEIVG